MRFRLSILPQILLILGLFLFHSEVFAWQWAAVSYYTLIKNAPEILVVRVSRIEGGDYSQKVVAAVERSFKKTFTRDTIELPFVYTSWPTGKNTFTSVSETVPISFRAGKRYVVILAKWHRFKFGPANAPETEYEVLNYPKRTFFEITDKNDPRIWEIERLLAIVNDAETATKVDSLLSLLRSPKSEERVDAIEALIDLKTELATVPFINALRNDPDPSVRYSAALGLGYLHADSIVDALMECAPLEKVRSVKYQIVASLGMRRARKATPLLLEMYPTAEYDIRNAILSTLSITADSNVVPRLIQLFLNDSDLQHRRIMAETIATFHTSAADTFSSALLDTAQRYWLKTGVMDGWSRTHYTAGFEQITRWTSVKCVGESGRAKADIQGLVFPLLRAVELLGTPEQIASTLKVYAHCDDLAIQNQALRIVKEQLSKDISPEVRSEVEASVKMFESR